ncbi:MAG: glycosyltransferase family 4 protein [Planctomycetaceae bacterium]|nr:glycosyltransferase family 4 protein [Planctomycetaceae bacterium]
MKIALVIERMDVFRGGRETSTAQTAAELAKRGHEVTILCQSGSWAHPGVQLKTFGRRGPLSVSLLSNFVADVQRETTAGAYDIVHSTLPVPGANVYQPRGGTVPGQAAASRRRHNVVTAAVGDLLRELSPLRRRMTDLERQVVADPKTLLLPVSAMIAAEFEQYYHRTEGVKIVYNAVDIPAAGEQERADWRQRLRYSLGVTSSDVVFLSVAKNLALKGVDRLIETFAHWYHKASPRAVRLVVVGQEMHEGYQRHAGLRDVGRLVTFLPWTAEVSQWYAAADACVLLSWYDPCSRVILEAVRWGLPSITTAYNGAAELLAGGAGIVVPSPRDRAGLAAALEAMMDPLTRRRCTEACSAVAASVSMDRHVNELLTAYEEARR